MYTEAPSLSLMLHRSWWVLLLRGLAAIAFGLLAWFQPVASAAALVLIFGIYAFVDGLLAVFTALRSRKDSRYWWLILAWGLVGVGVGLLTFIQPVVTALVLTIYIGAWALVTGAMQIIAAIRLRKEIEGEWLLILGGALSVLFGIFALIQPGAGMLSILWVLALYAVMLGVLMLILAFKLKKSQDVFA